MNRVIPRGEGIRTLRCTIRTSSLSILEMKSSSCPRSRSVCIISFITSRTRTESSIWRCWCIILSAFCWNCLGLTSSPPMRRGLSILLEETSRNLLANNCESMRYLCNVSALLPLLNTSGILDISTSWLSLTMKPFSSNDISCTMTLSAEAIPANR